MITLRRLGVVTTACLLGAGLATGPAPAAVASDGSVEVTGPGPATFPQSVSVEGGSSELLVYTAQPTTILSNLDSSEFWQPVARFAREADGTVVPLGAVPADTPRRILVAAHVVASVNDAGRSVELWDVSAGQHTTITLGAGEHALSAAPGGVLVSVGNDVRLRGFDGSVTATGTPFPGHPVTSVTANADRYVVTDAVGAIASATFAAFTSYQPLVSGTTRPVLCDSVNDVGVGCRAAGAAFVPLDGGVPTTVSWPDVDSAVAVSGASIRWLTDTQDEDYTGTVASLAAGSTSAVFGPSVGYRATPAYDQLAAEDEPADQLDFPDVSRIMLTEDAEHVTPVIEEIPSPESSAAFALTPSRLVYTSDLRDAARPDRQTRLRTASVQATATSVRVGPRQDVPGASGFDTIAPGPAADPTWSPMVAVGGSTTAYVGCVEWKCRVQVRTGTRTVTLPTPIRNRTELDSLAVSNGVVAVATHQISHPREQSVLVYNTRTRTTRRFAVNFKTSTNVAFTRGRLLMVATGGRVVTLDVKTGRTRAVYTPRKRLTYVNGVVAASGPWISWSVSGAAGRKDVRINQIRNVVTGRTISVAHTVYQLTDRGAMLDRGACVPSCHADVISYRPFNGRARVLLSAREYTQLPQLHGHVLAWIDSNGVLRVRRW